MISGTVQKSDFLKAQLLHKKLTSKKIVLILFLYCVVILLGVVALLSNEEFIGYLLIFGSIGNFISNIIINHYIFPKKMHKLYLQQKELKNLFTYKWDEEHIEASCSTGNSKRKWSNYLRIKENKNYILLYHSDMMFEVFPIIWFKSEEQLNEFRSYAINSIKS